MDKAILSFFLLSRVSGSRARTLAQDFGEMELVKEQGKGRHVGGPVLSGQHTHTHGQETAPSPLPQSRLSSPGKATLSQPLEAKEMESPTASRALSPPRGFSASQGQGRSLRANRLPRGSPSLCAAWCRAGLAGAFLRSS